MCRYACVLLPVILVFVFVREVSSIVCTKEDLFDTRPLVCPGPNDPRDKIYCCGPKKLRYCCSYADYASAINTIGIIVGVLVTAIVVVVIIVVVSCFCCSCCLLAKHRNRRGNTTYVDLGDLPMQNPDLFGGDMLGVEIADRNVIPQQHLRWSGRKVPYTIDPGIAGYTNLIYSAIQDYHTKTCIRFVPRSSETNYIRIFPGQGCYSNVGMIGRQQPVSLGQGCMFKGTIVHELGHAIGFFHEQNRSDRDLYLTIYWQNIQRGMDTQFFLLKPHENMLLTPFDYNSIMLYGNTAFSKDGRSITMAAKSGVRLYETYDKPGLSESDVIRVNKMYNC